MRFLIQTSRMRELNAMLSSLTKEAAIMTDEGGWEIRATDEAHVALLMLRISKSAFLAYESDDDQIVLDLEKLKKMLAHVKGCEVLSIEGDRSRLRFQGGPLAWTMKLPDDVHTAIKDPVSEYAARCRVLIDDLRKGSKAATCVAESIAVTTKGSRMELRAGCEDDEVELGQSIDPTTDARALYPLDYFNNCVQVLPGDKEGKVQVSFEDDMPLVLSVVTWDGALDARFLIAPQIQDGD